MIYARSTTGVTFLILDPENIKQLKNNVPLCGPDGQVFVLYTPDITTLAAKLQESDMDFSVLTEILDECKDLPEVFQTVPLVLGKVDRRAN